MSSVREIASQVGVSVATVSRVINNDPRVSEAVRGRVLAAVNQARYVPRVGRRSTTNIGFVYTGESSLGSPFDAALMQGMGERMEEYGFDLMILDATRARLPGETYSQLFMRKGIRGAVLRTTTQSRSVCEEIAAEGFPAVVVGDRFDSPGISFIYCDSRASSREAVQHLIDLSHRRIALSINVVDDSDHTDRINGYREALEAGGIDYEPRLVMRVPARRDGGQQLMRRLAMLPDRPTAVYATDPMVAVGAMNEALAMGLKVPGDISIVGFDDADLRLLVHPQLTAVCQDTREIGREAFEALHRVIGRPGKKAFVRTKLSAFLEMHGSTGLAPAGSPEPPTRVSRRVSARV